HRDPALGRRALRPVPGRRLPEPHREARRRAGPQAGRGRRGAELVGTHGVRAGARRAGGREPRRGAGSAPRGRRRRLLYAGPQSGRRLRGRGVITLTPTATLTVPLEAESITPDAFAGRTRADVERLPVLHGNRPAALADFFTVRGDADEA